MRGTIVEHHGVLQAAPALRFSGTPAVVGAAPVVLGADTRDVLSEWGIADELVASATAGRIVDRP